MKRSTITAGMLLAAAAPVIAAGPAAPGRETVVHFASNGGLRNWQAVPGQDHVVYVQDRQLAWYQVTVSGPCARDRPDMTMVYTTDNAGNFDRFSHISLVQNGLDTLCGVTSIKTSLPPPGQPGASKAPR